MNRNRITQSIIVGAAALIATASWSGLRNILFNDGSWLWPTIGFFVLLIFLSVNWLLVKSKSILLITLFFILISFFLSFGFKLEYLVALLVAFFFFFLGCQRALNEKEVRIKIQVISIFKRGLPFLLTGLCLIIATVYYFSPLALTDQNQIAIPRPLFNWVAGPILKIFEEQISTEQLNQFSQQLGIPLSQENLYQIVNQEVNKKGQAYIEYFSLGLAIGFFFALKMVSFFFMWLVILISWLIFKILVATGAVKIQEKAVLKQVIEV